MANDRVSRRLDELKAIGHAGPSDASIRQLRLALADKVNVIVAKAAAMAVEWGMQILLPDLVRAFSHLLEKPVERDPQCWGKNAVSKALKDLGFSESALFVKGLKHQQWEASWGGKTDSANVLRGICALALVQCTDLPRDETLRYLVDGAADSDARVRVDSLRALEQMGGRDVALVFRLKAHTGDEEAGVTGQVFESILHLDASGGVPFVSEFLDSAKVDVAEEAALALGVSRLPEALEALQKAWLKRSPGVSSRGNSEVLLRALSASRQDEALEFLLQLIRTARMQTAEQALRALEIHRDSDEITKRVQTAVGQRDELAQIFKDCFRK